MIKKLGNKRRGILMIDAVLAMVIIAAIIIPVSGAIAFAYSSKIDSAEVSAGLNRFHDKIDARILEYIIDGPVPLGSHAGTINIVNANDEDIYIGVNLMRFSDYLETNRRRIPVRVHMIQRAALIP